MLDIVIKILPTAVYGFVHGIESAKKGRSMSITSEFVYRGFVTKEKLY